jgi:hypothetical protein
MIFVPSNALAVTTRAAIESEQYMDVTALPSAVV